MNICNTYEYILITSFWTVNSDLPDNLIKALAMQLLPNGTNAWLPFKSPAHTWPAWPTTSHPAASANWRHPPYWPDCGSRTASRTGPPVPSGGGAGWRSGCPQWRASIPCSRSGAAGTRRTRLAVRIGLGIRGGFAKGGWTSVLFINYCWGN